MHALDALFQPWSEGWRALQAQAVANAVAAFAARAAARYGGGGGGGGRGGGGAGAARLPPVVFGGDCNSLSGRVFDIFEPPCEGPTAPSAAYTLLSTGALAASHAAHPQCWALQWAARAVKLSGCGERDVQRARRRAWREFVRARQLAVQPPAGAASTSGCSGGAAATPAAAPAPAAGAAAQPLTIPLALQSAAVAATGREPALTFNGPYFSGTIDYIWCSRAGLEATGWLAMPWDVDAALPGAAGAAADLRDRRRTGSRAPSPERAAAADALAGAAAARLSAPAEPVRMEKSVEQQRREAAAEVRKAAALLAASGVDDARRAPMLEDPADANRRSHWIPCADCESFGGGGWAAGNLEEVFAHNYRTAALAIQVESRSIKHPPSMRRSHTLARAATTRPPALPLKTTNDGHRTTAAILTTRQTRATTSRSASSCSSCEVMGDGCGWMGVCDVMAGQIRSMDGDVLHGGDVIE